MTEAVARMPTKPVLIALWKKGAEIREKVSSINGEFGDRVKAQVENGNLHSGAFRVVGGIFAKAQTNEIAALQHIDHLRHYLDIVEEEIRNKGHVGDLAEQAKQPVLRPLTPEEEAIRAASVASNGAERLHDLKELPAEGEQPAVAAKKGRGRPKGSTNKPKGEQAAAAPKASKRKRADATAAAAETAQAGDEHIRSLADKYVGRDGEPVVVNANGDDLGETEPLVESPPPAEPPRPMMTAAEAERALTRPRTMHDAINAMTGANGNGHAPEPPRAAAPLDDDLEIPAALDRRGATPKHQPDAPADAEGDYRILN